MDDVRVERRGNRLFAEKSLFRSLTERQSLSDRRGRFRQSRSLQIERGAFERRGDDVFARATPFQRVGFDDRHIVVAFLEGKVR